MLLLPSSRPRAKSTAQDRAECVVPRQTQATFSDFMPPSETSPPSGG